MKLLVSLGFCIALLGGAVVGQSQEAPEFPKPVRQHEWLGQLAGEWESDVTLHMPGQEPVKSQGTELVRQVGGFWIVGENRGEFMGQPFTGLLTLGYDADKNQFVGSWVDSVCGFLWKYEGQLDEETNTLTLETQGPCPAGDGTVSNFKEVLQLKSKDHKVFTSSVQAEDGTWTKMMHIEYRRKK
jgi:hypothetical protein